MYNCQLFKYKNSWQLRLYDFPIAEHDSNVNKSKLDSFDQAEIEVDSSFLIDPDNQYVFENKSHYTSVNHSKNKIFYYSRSVDWSGGFFVTLTIDPKIVNSFDYKECVRCLRYFLDNLRKYDNTIKYLFVPEKHKSGRFHFHGLITRSDLLSNGVIVDSGHYVGSDRIYNFSRFWKFGFSTLTKIKNTEAIEKYITKYTTKELLNDTLYQHRYFVSQNIPGADILKFNVDSDRLFRKLLSSDLVTFCNTDGKYNRVKYLELKNDDEVLYLLDFYGILKV